MIEELKEFPASRYPRSEEWKALLDHLLDNAEVCKIDNFTITFRLCTGEETSFFGLRQKKKYNRYEVWITNKDISYGKLFRVSHDDGYSWKLLNMRESPGYTTIHRLYDLEKSFTQNHYKIPE